MTTAQGGGNSKGKAVPLHAWSGLEGSRKLRFPDCMTTAQDGGNSKGKAVPLHAWSGLERSRKLRFPDFMTTSYPGGRTGIPISFIIALPKHSTIFIVCNPIISQKFWNWKFRILFLKQIL
jgi:hypothetical protein